MDSLVLLLLLLEVVVVVERKRGKVLVRNGCFNNVARVVLAFPERDLFHI